VLRLVALLDAHAGPGHEIPRVADDFEVLADEIAVCVDDCPELITGLERLVEARDWIVRAYFSPAESNDT
jgi:hypothetical protein